VDDDFFTLSQVSASTTLPALVLRPGHGAASASQSRRVRSGVDVGGQSQARFQHVPVRRTCLPRRFESLKRTKPKNHAKSGWG
jgi:hypothetical protein